MHESEPTPPQNVSQSLRELPANIVAGAADGGRIVDNILGFARVLRSAGLPIGTQKAIEATQAVMAAGLENPKFSIRPFI
jgi:uncharacterized protein with von Willebrand factor type A (vWA) domain